MSITNSNKPTNSLTGTNKVVTYETWDTNVSTWDTEIRTWDEMGTTWTNQNKAPASFLWSLVRFPWAETAPWTSEGGITNENKPA